MNWAQCYICKGISVKFFMKQIQFVSQTGHNLPLQTPRIFLPLPSVSQLQETFCVLSHLYGGKLKHHFLLELPRSPPHKHILTQLSTMALNIIYCNCLFTCLIWFHPLNSEQGQHLTHYHIRRQCLAQSRHTTYVEIFY